MLWQSLVYLWCHQNLFVHSILGSACIYIVTEYSIIMATLPSRYEQYIFAVVSFYLPFFPRLISAAAHWMSTILRHMMWP